VARQGLTDAYAVFMSAPLLVALLSRVVLKEQISPLRWLSILIGLVGVIIAIKPTGAELISAAGLAALATALFYAINVLSIRSLHPDDPAEAVVFWNIFGMAIIASVFALPNWVSVQPQDWLLIALVGATGALAQHLLTLAFRMAPASVVAPFEYTALIWGALIDLTVFHHVPALHVLVGAAVVTAAGIGLVAEDRFKNNTHKAEPDATLPLP
jgi:drug/metabolite transporter (DMT)-like permease